MLRVPNTGDFLLDTGCFYRLSGNYGLQTTLLSVHRRVVAAPLAVVELAAVPIDCSLRDFRRRQAAMQTLYSVCIRVLPEFPEELTARAFGCDVAPVNSPLEVQGLMHAVMLATSVTQLQDGVPVPLRGGLWLPRCSEIRSYKESLDLHWRDIVSRSTTWLRGRLAGYVEGPLKDVGQDSPREKTRALKSTAFRGGPLTGSVLVILARQAGLFTVAEYDQSSDDSVIPQSLLDRIAASYNGSMNAYGRAFNGYMTGVLNGETAAHNDWIDLEFFKYLDSYDPPLYFVTTEAKWVRIGREAVGGRVLLFQEFMNALVLSGSAQANTTSHAWRERGLNT
jgi:hypothetical protein